VTENVNPTVAGKIVDIATLFIELIAAGRRSTDLSKELGTANAARDDLILQAWAEGVTAAAIATATGLSQPRVQQIVQEKASPVLREALEQRRQNRRLSQQLLELAQQPSPTARVSHTRRMMRPVGDPRSHGGA
jgi:hypothetical protein